jgi:5'-3' exoribonuclease 2
MGVPLLLSWLKRYAGDCFIVGVDAISAQPLADNLYIDFNSLLYQAAEAVRRQEASDNGGDFDSSNKNSRSTASLEELEQAIIRVLFDILDSLVMTICRPRKLVYIAMDGVSPLGKMAEQRARRMSSRRQGSRMNGGGHSFDSNAFTCGTALMEKIALSLQHYCASRSATINSRRASEPLQSGETSSEFLSFIVNDWTTPGEGEQKIFAAIRCFRSDAATSVSDGKKPLYSANTRHCIVSNDTDVIICSLPLHEPFITVLQYDHRLQHDAMLAFSIELFRKFLFHRLGSPSDVNSFESALHDIVFVLLLFGNDFLPKISGVGDVQDGQLDRIVEFVASDLVTRSRTLVNPATAQIDFSSAVYLLQHLKSESSASRGGLEVIGMEGAMAWGFDEDGGGDFQRKMQQRVKDRAISFWTMLQWAVTYCCTARTPSWTASYPYATNDVPGLSDLIEYCGIDDARLKPANDAPVSVYTQLLLLLPESSTEQLLPPALLREYQGIFKPLLQQSSAVGPTITRETVEAVSREVARVSVRLTKQEMLRHRACEANASGSLAEFAVLWEPLPAARSSASDLGDAAEAILAKQLSSETVTSRLCGPSGPLPSVTPSVVRPATTLFSSRTSRVVVSQGSLDLFGQGAVQFSAKTKTEPVNTTAEAGSISLPPVAQIRTVERQPVEEEKHLQVPIVETKPADSKHGDIRCSEDIRRTSFSGVMLKFLPQDSPLSGPECRFRLQGFIASNSFHLPPSLPFLPPVRLGTKYGAVAVGMWSYSHTQQSAGLVCRPLDGCTAELAPNTKKRARASDAASIEPEVLVQQQVELDEKKMAIRRRIEEMKAQKLKEDICSIMSKQ